MSPISSMATITKRVCVWHPDEFMDGFLPINVNPPYDVTSIQHGYHNKTCVYGTLVIL